MANKKAVGTETPRSFDKLMDNKLRGHRQSATSETGDVLHV